MLVPHRSRIIVLPDEADDRSAGGIYIPDEAKKKPTAGVVVATGKGSYLDNGTLVPTVCEVGDHVVYQKYSGTEVELNGKKHLIMDDGDILGHFETATKEAE